MKIIEKRKKYIALFVVFLLLFAVIPYCDDDLRWGGTDGAQRLATWFDGYGGRYLGYLLILLMTKCYAAKVILQAAVLTALVYILDRLAYEKDTEYITVLFLFFMPLWMFKDTIGWASGFANYITSITFTLVYVKYVYARLDGTDTKDSPLPAIGFLLLGCGNALIVEHFTVYNICLGIFMVMYTLIYEKRVRMKEICYLLGVMAGTAMMFSNSTYRQVASGDDFYRGVNTSNLASMVVTRTGRILNICYLELPLVVIPMTIIIYMIWQQKKDSLSGMTRMIAGIGTHIICFGNPVILLADMTREYDHAAKNIGTLLLLVLVLASIVVTVGIFAFAGGRFWQCMGALISVAVPAMPFVVVSPMTYRCFVGSYIFWLLLLYQLLALIPDVRDRFLGNATVRKYTKAIAFLAVVFYIGIYGSIHAHDHARLEYIRSEAEKGASSVTIEHLANENFVHDITLDGAYQWVGYKDFYGIDPDIEILVRESEDD